MEGALWRLLLFEIGAAFGPAEFFDNIKGEQCCYEQGKQDADDCSQ